MDEEVGKILPKKLFYVFVNYSLKTSLRAVFAKQSPSLGGRLLRAEKRMSTSVALAMTRKLLKVGLTKTILLGFL